MATTRKARRLELLDTTTGELVQRKERVPHAFDGGGYTLEGRSITTPNFRLSLSGTEWDLLDWMKQNGGSATPLPMPPALIAPQLYSTENTIKAALARLVRLNLVLRIGGPRSGTYQLNPRRYWEGGGEAQVQACARLDPPPVTPDAKASAAALKAAHKAAEAARSAEDVATEVEQTMPDTSVARATRDVATQTAASAKLAAQTAAQLGAKLPMQLRRLLEEEPK